MLMGLARILSSSAGGGESWSDSIDLPAIEIAPEK
jgi:hypothetical protein